MTALGSAIALLRVQKGWTVYTLAKNAGLCIQTVRDLETMGSSPQFETVRRLAAALDVPLSWLEMQLSPVILPPKCPSRPRGRPPAKKDPP